MLSALRAGSMTVVLAAAWVLSPVRPSDAGETKMLKLVLKNRVPLPDGQFAFQHKPAAWEPKQTAIIVCDMWDTHHCLNAVRRVEEIAPRMNQVLEKARKQGVLIIHAPSSCMEPYKEHPGRIRAQDAPRAKNVPKDIGQWCYKIPSEEQGIYPLDQSDGGCDSDPAEQKAHERKLKDMGRDPRAPWKSQIDVLKIHDVDAISDSGVEIWNLLEHRGIQNVILVGVHTNMCVLGRPFGLRQMAKNKKNVVLMSDMTDTMYNPARWPYVSHYHGTRLIIEHIEKYVCPTITSDQILRGQSFRFKGDVRPKAVIAIAEGEYETLSTLPQWAGRVLEGQLGFVVDVLRGDGKKPPPDLAERLATADLLVLSVRRHALPAKDMAALVKYFDAGKPVIAIRTSSHAFDAKGKGTSGFLEWPTFDPDVLGGNYKGHHPAGPIATISAAAGADKHPILTDIKAPFTSKGSLYKTSPLKSSATPLLVGSIDKQQPEPIAWTHTYKKSRVFYTSLGHKDDFTTLQFQKLMHNAARWATNMPIVPSGGAQQK